VAEKLGEWEALILWALLAEGGRSYWESLLEKKMISKDHAADREALARARLITSENRRGKGQGVWMEVTDEGWRRAGENLGVALPTTKLASVVFQAWLTRLGTFMEARNLVLADILSPQIRPPHPEPVAPPPPTAFDYGATRRQIRDAYLDLTDGHFNVRVLLQDLREKLQDLGRGVQDQALKRMHLEEGTTLSGLNNPEEVTQAVREAGLTFKGEPMYVLWIAR
jgi:hypothetical protein